MASFACDVCECVLGVERWSGTRSERESIKERTGSGILKMSTGRNRGESGIEVKETSLVVSADSSVPYLLIGRYAYRAGLRA